MKVWCVFECEPGQQDRAKENLEEQGFTVLLPHYIRKIRHARKIERVKKPLFFQYGFIEIDLEEDAWRSINGTRGVSHLLLGSNQRPGIVSDKDMADVRAVAAQHEGTLHDGPPLSQGEIVKIMAGLFKDKNATVERTLDDGDVVKLKVHETILGREPRITLPRDQVEPAT